MNKKNIILVGTIPKSNIKIVNRRKIDIPNIQIHHRPLSWLGTGIKKNIVSTRL